MLLAVVLIYTSGCKKPFGINGNGMIEEETRPLVSFNRVRNAGFFNVFVQNDSIFSVSIEAESNLIPYVRTIINGNTLVIDTRETLNSTYPINVYVKAPIINMVELSGSGPVMIDSLNSESLELQITGSGNMSGYATTTSLITKISGSGDMLLQSYTGSCDARVSGSGDMELLGESLSGAFSISGSGDIRSYSYSQKECISKTSGSGDMYLNVSDFLDITISGSGDVYYLGNPVLNVKITGSGQVIGQ